MIKELNDLIKEDESVKPVNGFPGYFITDKGRLFSVKSGEPKEMSLYEGTYGYYRPTLNTPNGKRRVPVHKMVLEAFEQEKPDSKEARHLNGDKKDNRVENLTWGTHKENMGDIPENKKAKGENHGNSKLTDKKVIEAKKRHLKGETIPDLAREYNVQKSTMYYAINGDTWDHISI